MNGPPLSFILTLFSSRHGVTLEGVAVRLGNIREGRCDTIDEIIAATGPQRDALVLAVNAATRRLRFRCTEVMRSIARGGGRRSARVQPTE